MGELGVTRAYGTPEPGLDAAFFDHELHAVVGDVVGDLGAFHHGRIFAARGFECGWHHTCVNAFRDNTVQQADQLALCIDPSHQMLGRSWGGTCRGPCRLRGSKSPGSVCPAMALATNAASAE